MKKHILLFLFVVVSTVTYGQIKNPVEWKFSSKRVSATSYEVQLTASLEHGWHIYSQHTPAGGPLATSIQFSKNPLAVLKGSVEEHGTLEKNFEPLFDVEVRQFSDNVRFTQLVTVKSGIKTLLKGSVQYMVCDENQCLPARTLNFSIPLQ